MEFMMTYGWAVIIIVGSLSALFGIGIFSAPSLNNACGSVVGYLCTKPVLASNGLLSVSIEKLGGDSWEITGLGCSPTTSAPQASSFSSTGFAFQAQDPTDLSFNCPLSAAAVGTPFSGTLWIQYNQGTQTGLISQVGTVNIRVTEFVAPSTTTTSSTTSTTSSTTSSTSSTTSSSTTTIRERCAPHCT
jgi:hypothetical protein